MKLNQIVDSFLRAATLALAYLDLVIFMLPCWRQKDQVKKAAISFLTLLDKYKERHRSF